MAIDIVNMMVKSSDETIDDKFKIVEIDIDKIIPNENNFYSTEEIENLKGSIIALGLQHNLTVSKKDENGKYKIISGHRRYKAIQELIADGELHIKTLPCKIDNKTELEQRLALIVSNSTSREISPAEKMKQVEELKAIAKELKNSKDTKIKGKTRDFIAEQLNMSKSEVARYEAISNNLEEEIKEEFKQDNISTDTAYAISKLDKDEQKEVIEAIEKAKIEDKKITTKDVKDIMQKENKQTEPIKLFEQTETGTVVFDNQIGIDDVEEFKNELESLEVTNVSEFLNEITENKSDESAKCDSQESHRNDNEQELKNSTHKIYVLSEDFENISNGVKTFEIMPKGKCKIGDTIEIQQKDTMKRTYVKISHVAFESYFNNEYEIVSIKKV